MEDFMKKKGILVGISVLILVFSMAVIGCSSLDEFLFGSYSSPSYSDSNTYGGSSCQSCNVEVRWDSSTSTHYATGSSCSRNHCRATDSKNYPNSVSTGIFRCNCN